MLPAVTVRLLLILCPVLLLSGCLSKALPPVTVQLPTRTIDYQREVKPLLDKRCTVCHSRERIDQAQKTPEEWAATVDRMIGNGAQLSPEERQAVIDYLASR